MVVESSSVTKTFALESHVTIREETGNKPYLASPAGFALPRILANLATLIGGGVRGIFGK